MEFLKELWEIIKEHKGVVAFFGFFILIGVFGSGGSFADKIIYLLILLGMIAFFFFGNWVNWFPEKEDEIPPYQPRESVKTRITDEEMDELDRRYKESGEWDKMWERIKKKQKDYFFDDPDAYEEWLKWGEMSEEERETNGLPDTYDKWLESYWDKKNNE